MAATSQRQLRTLPAGRTGTAGRSLLLLVALSQCLGATGGKLFMQARSPSPSPQGSSAGVVQLLDMQQASGDASTGGPAAGSASATSFGPNGCVGLSKSSLGTCVIKVACGKQDVSKVDFSFVCLGKSAATKQHSYGVGGFDADEVFDSGVPCDSCTTVAYAQLSGGKLVHNEVLESSEEGAPADAAAALAKAPSPSDERALNSGEPDAHDDDLQGLAKAPSPGKRQFKGVVEDLLPNSTVKKEGDDAAFFGPSACISTYLSKTNTCIIQTRCRGVDLSNFAVGVTCLDKTGDYTRYLFGKNGFEAEEIFDTTLPCQACIGVGDQPSYQLSGLVPKTMVEDLSSLKSELSALRKEVTMMKNGNDAKEQKGPASGKLAPAPSPASRPAATAPSPSRMSNASEAANATDGAGANATKATAKKASQLLDASSALASGDAAEPKPTTVRDLLRRLVKEH